MFAGKASSEGKNTRKLAANTLAYLAPLSVTISLITLRPDLSE